jgi:hypothetical protein
MDTGEFIRAALKMYWKTFWPLWAIFTPIPPAFSNLFYALFYNDHFSLPDGSIIWPFYLLVLTVLPALFIGPAILNISNVILERPKKTLTSFLRGMSAGMILKIFLFFTPYLVLLVILYSNTQHPTLLYVTFNILLLFLTPLWIFYPMILLLEKKSVLQTVRRLRIFASGQFRKLAQIQIFLLLITVILIPLGGYIFQARSPDVFYRIVVWGVLERQKWDYLPNLIMNCLFYVMTIPFGIAITAYVLHYYQVRAEKENFSEELLAQELGYQPIEEMMTV